MSASIDVHGDTAVKCTVAPDGQVEIGLGEDSYLFLTPAGATKLVGVLADAGLAGTPADHRPADRHPAG
ncbi:hypothetical protein ABZ816_35895 [Actinosynnema sp. NPDC047251]|uniref:Uncharacterized protein n=1 Tax=Saccharothrix espanaensis (strain ATCC 51144 / DSM 44229 / JCM 9112 / NBRC 15066 / NRRL 15764) TaxID=1179773 RepID=K0JPT3_SACES|nr:hypothetical protein [Saccharothrix espanaensis]CCH29130.1 hypothetical protein BN6_18090 [Saccharothrix espanaensis DSM 44229]